MPSWIYRNIWYCLFLEDCNEVHIELLAGYRGYRSVKILENTGIRKTATICTLSYFQRSYNNKYLDCYIVTFRRVETAQKVMNLYLKCRIMKKENLWFVGSVLVWLVKTKALCIYCWNSTSHLHNTQPGRNIRFNRPFIHMSNTSFPLITFLNIHVISKLSRKLNKRIKGHTRQAQKNCNNVTTCQPKTNNSVCKIIYH